jgi:vacuolar protein sorting-associated protein 13A/C
LGELKLVIPWNNLGTKPVIVNVKDVYVLAIPRTESSVSKFSQKKKEKKSHITWAM